LSQGRLAEFLESLASPEPLVVISNILEKGESREVVDTIRMSLDAFRSRFEMKNQLGAGTYGTVFRAFDRLNQCNVAVK
jgi:hypothetical protein